MKKILILLTLQILILSSYGQEVLEKNKSIQKFGWPNAEYWMQYLSDDTSSMVSLYYDKTNKLKTISSSYGTDKFVPYYDSTLKLNNYKTNGTSVEFYDNYQVKSIKTYYSGIPIGTWLFYYPTGQIESIENYPNDSLIYNLCPNYVISHSYGSKYVGVGGTSQFKSVPHGDWIEFYTNGNVKTKKKFEMGLATGEWTWYYENSRVKKTGSYYKILESYPCDSDTLTSFLSKDQEDELFANHTFLQLSVKHGTWKQWDVNGNIILIERYNKGVLIK